MCFRFNDEVEFEVRQNELLVIHESISMLDLTVRNTCDFVGTVTHEQVSLAITHLGRKSEKQN